MPQRRRYTKHEKLSAVMAAELVGLTAASEQSGVPKSTLVYWVDQPEFAQFRTKTREELQAEVKVVAHLAWKRIAEALRTGDMEPRDAIFAAEKSTTLMQLLAGDATSRNENVSLTDGLSDDEKRRLRGAIAEAARAEAGGPGDGDGVETPSEAAPATA
jgi:transposase-like protein